jgi:hypothetical protein
MGRAANPLASDFLSSVLLSLSKDQFGGSRRAPRGGIAKRFFKIGHPEQARLVLALSKDL